ncbi:MAG TPA: lipid-binding SYLF domain-containing protein [Pyrinomonadaceae bacterium]|nr:lipid-binding SYLF domain-containing protein [Pyrinomonadaceae bacterium]
MRTIIERRNGNCTGWLLCGLLLLAVTAAGALPVSAQRKSKPKPAVAPTEPEPQWRGPNTKEGASQAAKSAKVLTEIMATPDKGIPRDLLAKAECVAVFPKVVKAGFIIGGSGGRGVASCRTSSGWSAPAFFEIKGGSVGLQAGGSSTDFVLLFMNENGMKSLLSDKFELGGEASVAAGPVGRTTSATTDIKMDAQILSYSRSKGLFGGLSLKGSVISPEKSDMEGTYGSGINAQTVLTASKSRAPSEVQVFPNTLTGYSTR